MSIKHSITEEDIIKKIHELINYNEQQKLNKPTDVKQTFETKYFNNINIKYDDYYDDIVKFKTEYGISFYSFMYCLFSFVNKEFKKYSKEDQSSIIECYIQDFILKLKTSTIIKKTPNFNLNKGNITSYLYNKNLNDVLILFFSVYFNINIFVIDPVNNITLYYSMTHGVFNKFKHNMFLVKVNKTSLISMQLVSYYKLVLLPNCYYTYNNEIYYFLNSGKNIIPYQQDSIINSDNVESNIQDIKIDNDNDLEIIELNDKIITDKQQKKNEKKQLRRNFNKGLTTSVYGLNNQIEEQTFEEIEKKLDYEKNILEKVIVSKTPNIPDNNSVSTVPEVTIEKINEVTINKDIDLNNKSNKYTKDELKKMKIDELKKLLKLNHIDLTILNSENNKRKAKTKDMMIEDLLKI